MSISLQLDKMYYVLILLILSSCGMCQVPNLLWETSYGGDYSDLGYSITAGQNSGYVIGGTCSISGANDAFLQKLDSLGNQIWVHSYPSDYYGTCYSVIQTADGGYIFTGQDGNMPFSYLQLTKTDSEGNMEWQNFYQGSNDHLIGYSVLQTEDMGFIVTGTDMGYYKVGNQEGPSRNSSGSMFLMKTDSIGNEEWFSSVEWPGMDYVAIGYSVIHSPDGGYIIAGSSVSSGTTCGFIAKTDSIGNKEWLTYLDPELCYWLKDIIINNSDECLAVGRSPLLSSELYDFVIAKTDLQGNLLFINLHGGDFFVSASAIISTLDGGYAVTGATCADSSGEYASLLLSKFNSTDELEWSTKFGADSDYNGADLLQESNGNYTIVGSRNYLPQTYYEDAWIIQVGFQSGVNESFSDVCCRIGVSSNPIRYSAGISLLLPEPSSSRVDMFDLQGRLIQNLYSGYLTEGEHFIECPIQSGLPAGCYVLRMETDSNSDSVKCLLLD